MTRNYGNHSCVLDGNKTPQTLYSASVRLFCATIASYTIAFDLQFLKMERNASLKCWMSGISVVLPCPWWCFPVDITLLLTLPTTLHKTSIPINVLYASWGTPLLHCFQTPVIIRVNEMHWSAFALSLVYKYNQHCSTDRRTDGQTDRHDRNTLLR